MPCGVVGPPIPFFAQKENEQIPIALAGFGAVSERPVTAAAGSALDDGNGAFTKQLPDFFRIRIDAVFDQTDGVFELRLLDRIVPRIDPATMWADLVIVVVVVVLVPIVKRRSPLAAVPGRPRLAVVADSSFPIGEFPQLSPGRP